MTTRLFLIDDHCALREGLRILLESRGDFEVVGESDSGESALSNPQLAGADVVLLDLNLPGLDGLQLLSRFQDAFPGLRTVVFTVHQEEPTVLAALERGASGYVLKSASSWELAYALRTVAQGGTFLHPQIAPSILKHLNCPKPEQRLGAELTEREVEILQRLANGESNKTISEELFLSPNTIKTHLRRTYRKLGVQDKTQAVVKCMEAGLFSNLKLPTPAFVESSEER